MKQLDVVTFGEAMAMFIADQFGPLHKVQQYTLRLAGAETNVAIGLSRLGLKSGWMSKVGEDAFGKFVLDRLEEEKVDVSKVTTDCRYPTGFQIKSKVVTGDPEVQYYRKGSAASHLGVEEFPETYFVSARHLHVTGIPLAISENTRAFAKYAMSYMRKQGKTISFDPNLRPNLWNSKEEMIEATNQMAAQADVVLPGIMEGEILTGYKSPRDIAYYYLELGVKTVVVKLGEEGAFYKTEKEEAVVAPFKVSQIVDTVGAGDGFAVGVISGILENTTLAEAVLRGNAIGSLAVQSIGDSDGYPTRGQLNDYIQKNLEGVK